ncbi:MAG: YceD family protein [bacterium]|nr:YceD family protein [bacterium]
MKVVIEDRLPSFIKKASELDVMYQVEAKDDFYLIHLNVKGDLTINCQRCAQEFILAYDNTTVIAVCRNDERAEQLLELYECIVSSNWQVDLNDLISDELHLYVPLSHEETNDCDSEINQFLTREIETY